MQFGNITKLVKRTKLCADNFDSERVADIRARNITHPLSKTTERAVVLETEPYILTSVICVHALVRALGKCGAVRFRNGRFISPVVLDEYLERRSVDAVLRQEREKETDPFL